MILKIDEINEDILIAFNRSLGKIKMSMKKKRKLISWMYYLHKTEEKQLNLTGSEELTLVNPPIRRFSWRQG